MKLLNVNKNKFVLILAILVVSIVIMRFFDSYLKNEICKNGIVSFELAKNLSVSKNIINSWNSEAKTFANYSLYFDFIFLTIYSFFIAILIHKTKFRIKKVFIYTIFTAAFFDIIENVALLNLTHNNLNQLWTSIAFYSATIKFTLIIVSLVYLIVSVFVKLFKTNR